MSNIGKLCIKYCLKKGYSFKLKGENISYEEVFSTDGLLPVFAKKADAISTLVFGYGIGVSFKDSADAKMGTTVAFDEFSPEPMRLLCIVDFIESIAEAYGHNEEIVLDQLLWS